MSALHTPRFRRTRPPIRVSPGAWIRIQVPGEPFPVHMRVGNSTIPAFIDHEPVAGGGYTTVAAVRCPNLPPGDYPVTVRLPDGKEIETSIEVA